MGVDGGGTKTHIALMNHAGKVKCEGFAGPSNPLRVGVETSVDNILKATNEACDQCGASRGDIVAATLGLAGVRRADIRQRVRESFEKRIGVKNVLVVTDAEIALYATTLGKSGLVVVAGTGSVCLGKNNEGKIAISGGWGGFVAFTKEVLGRPQTSYSLTAKGRKAFQDYLTVLEQIVNAGRN